MFAPVQRLPVVFVLILCCGLAGCGRGSQPVNPSAFDSAAPGIKEAWSKAAAADQADDYVAAATNYEQILQQQGNLPEAQFEAARQAFGLLNQRLVDAAMKGDPAAKQALAALGQMERSR
jgi:hypothetical protein